MSEVSAPDERPSSTTLASLRTRWGALRNIGPFMGMVWQASPVLSSAAVGLRLLRALIPVVSLWVAKLLIDEVVRLTASRGDHTTLSSLFASGEIDHLLLLVGLEFGLAIASDLLSRLVGLVDSLLSETLTMATSLRLMDHAGRLDLKDFEDAAFQDKLERARRQASGRMTLTGQLLSQIQDVVTVASFAAGLVLYEPWLILLLLVALVPAFLGEAHFNARSYNLDFWRTPERRELDYVRQTAASVETAKEVKIFGLTGFLADRYRDLSMAFYAGNRRIARARAAWGALFTGIGTVGYYLAYLWIVGKTLVGTLTIGDLAFLAGSFQRLSKLLEGLLSSFSSTASQALYLDDLFDFFSVTPAISSVPGALPIPRPIVQGISFQDVGFRYPGSEGWAVRHLTFSLAPGETLALVGENGAGKTTLVKLLTRLYDPDEGRILLDGRDLREYDVGDLHAAMGVIFQDFVRYHLSAGDNIAVGRIDARQDRARIAQAAHQSGAAAVIERLSAGYDQMIGKRFRKGVELSGGEWQKIAIARAYMRDAQILILDEPTAALDARSEFEVFERFKDLGRGKMALLISHRFSSVRMADRILVLAGGRVEAQGTHAELMAQKGRYAELFELQAAGYR